MSPQYAQNKKARFDYEILETLEGGLILTGPEVKSVRNGSVKLTGGFVTFHGSDALLTNVHISPYPYSKVKEYDPTHSRKLLLKRKEITYLRGKMQEKGLTIVPLSLYTKGRHIKIEIGIAKGKKSFDKRESIKRREQNREIGRMMKKYK